MAPKNPREVSEFRHVIENGTWDNCKMHVLLELTRISRDIEKIEKKLDRIIWIAVTIGVGVMIAVVTNLIIKGVGA